MRIRFAFLCGAAVTGLLHGCAAMHESVDFERHTLSTIYESRTESGTLIFEAKITPEFPDGDPVAEARRIEWLEGWLKARGFCPNGYVISDRRPIDARDVNLYHNDVRYLVKCSG